MSFKKESWQHLLSRRVVVDVRLFCCPVKLLYVFTNHLCLLQLLLAARINVSNFPNFVFFLFERNNSMNLHCLKYQVKSVTEARSLAG